MAFSLHTEKYTRQDLKGLEIHNERKENYNLSNKNIDKNKLSENYHIGVHYDNYIKRFEEIKKERITGLVRKNSIAGVGVVVSADNDFFKKLSEEKEKEFFQKVYDEIAFKYGKENIISAVVHKDETTPHLHLMVCPVTSDGRLSAKELFGRVQLRELQDIAVTLQKADFSLERGDKDRKVKHLSEIDFKLSQELKKLNEEKEKIEKIKNALLTEKEKIKNLENTFSDVEKIKNQVLDRKMFWYENVYKINSNQLNELCELAKNSENILELSKEIIKEKNRLVERNSELVKEINELEKTKKKFLELSEKNSDLQDELEVSKLNLKNFENSLKKKNKYIEKLEDVIPKEEIEKIKKEIQPKKTQNKFREKIKKEIDFGL